VPDSTACLPEALNATANYSHQTRDCPLAREPSRHRSFLAISLHLRSPHLFDTYHLEHTKHWKSYNAPPAAASRLQSNTYHQTRNTSQTSPTWWAKSQDEPFCGKKVSILLSTTGQACDDASCALSRLAQSRRCNLPLTACHPVPSLYAPG
jgi:hypothetical protein